MKKRIEKKQTEGKRENDNSQKLEQKRGRKDKRKIWGKERENSFINVSHSLPPLELQKKTHTLKISR